jgi:hypothetical protein
MNSGGRGSGIGSASFGFSASVGFSSSENNQTKAIIAAPPIKSTGAVAAIVEPAAISGIVCFTFIILNCLLLRMEF